MKIFQKKNVKVHAALISGAIMLLGALAYQIGIPFLDLVELKTIDLRFQTRGQIAPGPEVVLAVIDEKSVAREGKWVWPRTKIADLIRKLSDAGAGVIAFDIGFLEPDDQRVIRTIDKIAEEAKRRRIPDNEIYAYLADLKEMSDNDRLLAQAIVKSRARVVLGYFFQMDPKILEHMTEEEVLRHQENIRGSAYQMVRWTSPEAQGTPLITAVAPQSNIPVISESTEKSGFFNMYPDPDGVVRWMPAVLKFNEGLYAPLSLLAVSAYLDAPVELDITDLGVDSIRVGSFRIPTDEFGRILINYRGGKQTFPHIPVTDILNSAVPDDPMRDKIVIVGATAVGIYDLRVTPFGSVFPGLEIHANIIDSLLRGDYLYLPAWGVIFDIMVILVFGSFLGFVLARVGVISGAITGLVLFVGYIVLCQLLFSINGWVMNLVYPLSVILAVYIAVTGYRYLVETRQKKFVKDAFSTYLAPSVVRDLIESPERLVLGGEERVITAFFSDVEGFTSISERLTPRELVELLNEFLTEMTEIILTHEGTVDKFEGDAIIAFFGAPNELESQEEVACMACIEMQKRLAQLRDKWRKKGMPELMMRIGLSTGPAVVGNMGSKSRMDYTMMGDTVNTAARLEGVNKVYGTYTMISDSTFRDAGEWIRTRELDAIKVVGKAEPVKIYELLGYPADLDDRMIQVAEHYSRGLQAYRARQWISASEFFSSALKVRPGDSPSQTMLDRCAAYQAAPPPSDWDGSFSMTSK
ncbi:Adenylate cyclase (EC [Olavius algarvensis associated proteobacterium Delta 3]|nr:Adenylate cyclase (EC [Olavius algarvensis associated proteobacterium Delta 3]